MGTETGVIRAFPGAEIPEQPVVLEREWHSFCAHEQIALNEHSRTVRCTKCEKVFDPFSFLQNDVAKLQQAWQRHKEVRASLDDLIQRVEALKKEEARLKARIKTARPKAEPVIDVRNRGL